jgi:hypothetical protein
MRITCDLAGLFLEDERCQRQSDQGQKGLHGCSLFWDRRIAGRDVGF